MKTLVLATAALAAMTAAASAQTAVRIATEGAYAPYNFINDAGEIAGFEIDLGNAICERAGLTCEWVITAWDSMIPNLLAGNYDVIMAGMSVTEERLQSIDFSAEYYPPDPAVFVTRAGVEIDFDTISGLRIGSQVATIQAGYIEENYAAANTIVLFDTFDQAVADLAAGNLDLLLVDGGYIIPVVEAAGGALVLTGPAVVIGGGVAAGIRKEDDEITAAFDAVIAEMKADGSLNALITEWFDPPNLF